MSGPSPMDTSKDSEVKEFTLSHTLSDFKYAPRDVAVSGNDYVAVMEERGMLSVWQRVDGSVAFQRLPIFDFKMEEELGMVVECLSAHACAEAANLPPHTFACGGKSKKAQMFTASGDLLTALYGHENSVNSISLTSRGDVITGSFDGTARIWRKEATVKELTGHQYAVEVLGLPTGEIVTGSGNKSIIIFKGKNIVKKIEKAHNHAVRKLVPHPRGFVSCGNDGHIKVWTVTGECVLDIAAHTEDIEFMYGVAVTAEGDIISCGDDGTVRVFNVSGGGQTKQVIRLPGAVRGVKIMTNGDLVCACSDRSVRIFTRDPQRVAPAKELEQFQELSNLVAASGMKALDSSQMADETALTVPGSKDGEVKVVKTERGPMAFAWSAATQNWNEIGEAIGRPGNAKTALDGVEYDQVIDVEITEGQKIKLGFNRDDDPYDVAHRFCAIHSLPDYLRQQIIDYLTPLCSPELHKKRVEREQKEAEERSYVHLPCWKIGGFQLHIASKPAAMKNKLVQVNGELAEAGNALVMKEDEHKTLDGLINTIADAVNYHQAPFAKPEAQLMLKMLNWPTDKALAVLDAYRVLMCHSAALQALGTHEEVVKLVLNHAKSGNNTALSLALKAWTNWIGKRPKQPSERAAPPSLTPEVNHMMTQILETVTPLCVASKEANVVSAFTLLLHNVVVWLGRLGVRQSNLLAMVAEALTQLLASELAEKTSYYALMTLGSLAFISEEMKQNVKASFGDKIQAAVQQAKNSNHASIKEVANEVARAFKL